MSERQERIIAIASTLPARATGIALIRRGTTIATAQIASIAMTVGIVPIVPTVPGAEIVRAVPIVPTLAIARMRTGLLAAAIRVVDADV